MIARRLLLWRVVVLLLLLVLASQLTSCRQAQDFVCHDPDAGGTLQNSDRRFVLFGSDDSGGTGLGNFLVFYPAAYYFAAFTGRDLIISDGGVGSVIAEVCRIITCGFPFASDLARAYPGILTEEKMRKAPLVKKGDFQQHLEGSVNIDAHVVRAFGFIAQSDWWVYFNYTAQCVSKITGCDLGDVSCAERHAFQRLIRGPFRASYTAREEARVHGVPDNVRHAILTLPHAYAPRFDAAIHIRAQFHHFENQVDVNDPAYKKEVHDWIQTEGQSVFREMELKLLAELGHDDNHRANASMHHGVTSPTAGRNNASDPIYVYLAGDNEEVKEAFVAMLEQRRNSSSTSGGGGGGGGSIPSYDIRVMRMDASSIYHVKNLARLKNATNNEGVFDLVFDWYALSLSNKIFAWRKGSSGLISTFSQSASRVSGTTQRTMPLAPLNEGGVGTKGYQLEKDKRGNFHWKQHWCYAFLEDFKRPGDL